MPAFEQSSLKHLAKFFVWGLKVPESATTPYRIAPNEEQFTPTHCPNEAINHLRPLF